MTGSSGSSAIDALRNVTTEPTEIEDSLPLAESLEWRLADVYWNQAGVIPFARNDVPYLINNTGRLSENAAALVFAAFDEMRSSLPKRLILLELGAGTGLYARYFLDAFSALCRDAGSHFYDRLTYVVTDRFERTVTGWQETGVFAEHEGHVALRVCDAAAPDALPLPEGGAPLDVFCNYLLDVLPSRIVKRAQGGFEQLRPYAPGRRSRGAEVRGPRFPRRGARPRRRGAFRGPDAASAPAAAARFRDDLPSMDAVGRGGSGAGVAHLRRRAGDRQRIGAGMYRQTPQHAPRVRLRPRERLRPGPFRGCRNPHRASSGSAGTSPWEARHSMLAVADYVVARNY